MAKTKVDLKNQLLADIQQAENLIFHYEQTGNTQRIAYLNGQIEQCEKILDEYLKFIKIRDDTEKTDQLFKAMLGEYKAFINKNYGIPIKIDKTDALALRKIIEYLGQITHNNDGTLASWQIILKSFHTMPNFIANFVRIRQINKNLFNIITIIKRRANDKYRNDPKYHKHTTEINELAAEFVDQASD